MMNYLEEYNARMEARGGSVGGSFRQSTHHFKEVKFADATTYRRANIYINAGTDDEQSKQEDIRVIEIDRQGALRNILFKPTIDYEIGCIIEFDNTKWLAYDKFGSAIDDIKLRVSRINDILKWKDRKGVIQNIPCITSTSYLGSGSKANDVGLAYNVFDMRTPVGKILIAVELNKVTTNLELGQRFICGKRVYSLEDIDDISSVDENYKGVLQLTLKVDTINPTYDDFETGLAYQKIWSDVKDSTTETETEPDEDEGLW